jgi:hypothetical protein
MEKYVKVFPFAVMNTVEDGKAVYMVDKRLNEVFCVNSMSVERIMTVLRDKEDTERYDFWYIEVVGETHGKA